MVATGIVLSSQSDGPRRLGPGTIPERGSPAVWTPISKPHFDVPSIRVYARGVGTRKDALERRIGSDPDVPTLAHQTRVTPLVATLPRGRSGDRAGVGRRTRLPPQFRLIVWRIRFTRSDSRLSWAVMISAWPDIPSLTRPRYAPWPISSLHIEIFAT